MDRKLVFTWLRQHGMQALSLVFLLIVAFLIITYGVVHVIPVAAVYIPNVVFHTAISISFVLLEMMFLANLIQRWQHRKERPLRDFEIAMQTLVVVFILTINLVANLAHVQLVHLNVKSVNLMDLWNTLSVSEFLLSQTFAILPLLTSAAIVPLIEHRIYNYDWSIKTDNSYSLINDMTRQCLDIIAEVNSNDMEAIRKHLRQTMSDTKQRQAILQRINAMIR